MSQGFIQIPRSLLDHPTVRSCPHSYFRVLITILEYAAFLPCQQDDHGEIIDLKPGQLMCTERQLGEWADVDDSTTRRAIMRFKKVKILQQEVKHKKTIITITHEETYDLIKSYSEARSEAKVKQERSKSEAEKDNVDNADTGDKKKKIKKEKILIREWVSLSQDEIDKFFHVHDAALANLMLDILDSYNTSRQKHYLSDYGALKQGGWVHKEALSRQKDPNKLNRPKIDRRTQNSDGSPVEFWNVGF